MRAFVTVGSTQFDPLITASLSPPVIKNLRAKGYTHLVVQCGRYSASDVYELQNDKEGQSWEFVRDDIQIEVWRYKPSLQQDFEAADLVISHAGKHVVWLQCRRSEVLTVYT